MKKIYLSATVVLICNCLSAAVLPAVPVLGGPSQTKVTDLGLASVLQKIKGNIEIETEQGAQDVVLVSKTLDLLSQIIDGFNKGHLLAFEYKFLSICRYFKNANTVEPRHIRVFRLKIKKLRKHIKRYFAERKNLMSRDEIEMCNKIYQFSLMLSTSLLESEYLGITVADQVLDLVAFRPYELLCAHPVATGALVAATVLPITWILHNGYSCGYDGNGGQYKIPEGIVVREASDMPQRELRCGHHALRNTYGPEKAGNSSSDDEWHEVIMQANLARIDVVNQGIKSLNTKISDLASSSASKPKLDSLKRDLANLTIRQQSLLKRIAYQNQSGFPLFNDMRNDEIEDVLGHENDKQFATIKVFSVSVDKLNRFLGKNIKDVGVRDELQALFPGILNEWRTKKEVRFIGNIDNSHYIMYRVTPEHIIYRDSNYRRLFGGYENHRLTYLLFDLFHRMLKDYK